MVVPNWVTSHSKHLQIGSLEEIAYSNGWIPLETLRSAAQAYGKSDYGRYLQRVADGEVFYPRND